MPEKDDSKFALRHRKYEPGIKVLKNPFRIAAPGPRGHARLSKELEFRMKVSAQLAPEEVAP
jgi:hypothetical protein